MASFIESNANVRKRHTRVALKRREFAYKALAFRIASQTRCGLAGISKWLMPSGRSASTTAFIADVIAPAHPASPQPFAPSGLVVEGTGWLCHVTGAGKSVKC